LESSAAFEKAGETFTCGNTFVLPRENLGFLLGCGFRRRLVGYFLLLLQYRFNSLLNALFHSPFDGEVHCNHKANGNQKIRHQFLQHIYEI